MSSRSMRCCADGIAFACSHSFGYFFAIEVVGAGQCVEAVVEYDMAVAVDNRHSQISYTARQSQNRDAVGELVEDIVVNHLKPLI